MNFCTNCGAQLGFGRFCTNCGQPIPAPEQTAPDDVDKTQVRIPRVQPDASTGPRFPLYAPPPATPPTAEPAPPQVPATAAPAANPGSAGLPPQAPATPPPGEPYPTAPPPGHDGEKRRSAWPWVALVLVLLLGTGGGVWALTRGGDDDKQDASASETTGQSSEQGSGPSDDPSESTTPDIPDPPEGDPVNVASEATVSGPKPTKPGQSVDGTKVSYPATNMLDDDPTTAYRIDGDATGATITFTFDEPVLIEEVGLINGYAKVDGKGANKRDWYVSNRKVLRVEWSFDDGTTAEQDLRRTTDLQAMQVAGTMTETVTLRLLQVSKPGKDPRNTTAISTVLLRGVR